MNTPTDNVSINDLVRVETVCRSENEDLEGLVGIVIDMDIDDDGHQVYWVHNPHLDVDVRARSVLLISKAKLK